MADRGGSRADAQLPQQRADVELDRVLADAQSAGNLPVRQPRRDLFEDFLFARGQRLDQAIGDVLAGILEVGVSFLRKSASIPEPRDRSGSAD